MTDLTFSETFNYTHQNPYHDKLSEYADFVLRDKEGEAYQGIWNQDIFKRKAPLMVEIGSGHGDFMMDYCENNPSVNFIGIDYRFKRSFQLAKNLEKKNLSNLKFLRAKGERIEYLFGNNEVDRLYYFFPDPWPKTRHHKKRLFQAPFLNSAYKVLRPGGEIHIKTDHDGYALWMLEEISKSPLFELTFSTMDLRGEHPTHSLAQFTTKFEKIFIKKGILIKAFCLKSKKTEE